MDWRDIFKRYIDVVGEQEGTDFLEKWDWSDEEWTEIEKVRSERPLSTGWLNPAQEKLE